MCPAPAPHRQHPEPAAPVLAHHPLSDQAFFESVPKLHQESARCQSARRDLQPHGFQTAEHQVKISSRLLSDGCPDSRQTSVQAWSCKMQTVKHTHTLADTFRLTYTPHRLSANTWLSAVHTYIGQSLFYPLAVLCN